MAKARERTCWPVAYRWMAMGTLMMYTAVGSKAVYAAPQAAGTGREPQSPVTQIAEPPWQRFEIPSGSLEGVLSAFEQACGIHASLAEPGILQIPSPGVSGVLTAEQALRKLLAGTGIDYRFTGASSIRLEIKPVAAKVDVTDSVAALGGSSARYTQSNLDTPQSISVVPGEILNQQGTTTLRDALRNVAGISLAAGEGGSQGDNLTIRGFTARNDLFLDGMRDFGSYYRDPFNTEEVEVLQGPSSVTFGRGSTGGVVNQESKTPQLNHFFKGALDLGSDWTRRVTADINTPVPQLGSGAAWRLNLMGDENNVAGRKVAENRRFGVAPALALGLGSPTRWTFSYLHQTADDIPDYGLPWLFNGPAPVNRSNYYGFEQGNYLRTYDDIGTMRVEHDFNGHFTLRDQVRYANYVRHVQITEPQVLNASLSTPLAALLINRNQIAVDSTETNLAEQLDLTGNFKTGVIQHTLVTGIEAARETSDPVRPKYTNVPTTSLLNPDPSQVFAGIATPSTNVHTTGRSEGVYALDTMRIGSHIELTGGIRWDRFATDYTQSVTPAAAFSRVDQQPTWRAAATYKPVPAGSIYFAAGTSFNPSAETLALSAANANLPPEENRTMEAGAKWDLSGGKLAIRGAVFRTQKTNAREPDPNNPLLNVLAGNQRVDGVQLEVRGRLTSRWEILSSYAYLDGRVVSSQYYPAAIGAQLANVPRNTFNIWNTYRPWKRWETGIGAHYTAGRTASSTVPDDPITGLVKQVPAYWVFDAMLEHPITEHVSLQVNAYNLANRYYYDEPHPGHIVPGAGRSALVGVKFKF